MSSPTNHNSRSSSGGASLLARTAAVAAAASGSGSGSATTSNGAPGIASTSSDSLQVHPPTPTPTTPPPQSHTHARAYLDALFPPSRRPAAAVAATTTPTTATPSSASSSSSSSSSSAGYKPQKPSSLASSAASATGSDSDSSEDGDDGGESTNTSSAAVATATPPDPIQPIFAILDDAAMDEEDQIDAVRTRIGRLLEDYEGAKPSPFRLDGIVLDLMHRHREDTHPTGTVFPSSPIRRPGSVRSFSSNASRPWTPTPAKSSGGGGDAFNAATGTIGSAHLGGVQLPRSGSPGPAATGGTSGSQTSSYNAAIGSGSPRASPRLWNDAPGGGAGGGAGGGGGLGSPAPSSAGATSNPWSSMLTGPLSSSASSSLGYSFNPFGSSSSSAVGSASASTNPPASPFSAVPPGLAAPGLTSTSTSLSSSSRPTSPSPLPSPRIAAALPSPRVNAAALPSPRMNVAALAFKPRTGSTSSSHASSQAIRPSLLHTPSSSRRSSIQTANDDDSGDSDDHDDDEDEFSPFATPTSFRRQQLAATATARSSALASSTMMNATGSTAAGTDSAAMSAFDVLSSVLAPAAGAGADTKTMAKGPDSSSSSSSAPADDAALAASSTSWSPEQIEEALASHGYDVDATLAAIFEAGGKPGQWRRGATQPTTSTTSTQPSGATAPARSAPGAAGVSLMPREAFASYRGGANKGGGGGGGPSATAAYAHAHAIPSSPALANNAAIPLGLSSSPSLPVGTPPLRGSQSPIPGNAAPLGGGGGGAGPGRVCRYFLSGDCRRADCRFSHDLSKALCKFWLRGMCLNDPCPFLHDEELVRGLVGGVAAASLHSGALTPPVYTPGGGARHSSDLNRDPFDAVGQGPGPGSAAMSPALSHASGGTGSGGGGVAPDFPELPPSGPRAQREKQAQAQAHAQAQARNADNFPPPGTPTGPAASDPTRNRWANALQRSKPSGPLAAAAAVNGGGGDTGLISVHARHAPASRPPPSGPRAAAARTTASSTPSASSAARIPLRAPTLLPTLSVGKSVSQAYATYRSRSSPVLQSLLTQRNQLLTKASEAFRKMDGAGARKYSSEANALNVRIKHEEDGLDSGSGGGADAAREMLRDRHKDLAARLREAAGADGGGWGSSANASLTEPGARGLRGQLCHPNGGLGVCLGVARRDANANAALSSLSVEERTEWFLDCHGLHVHEALEIVEEFLLLLESSYPSHRGLTYLGVGIGAGAGAGEKRSPKLAAAVKGFLASWGYPHVDFDGVVAVDHLTHAM